MSASAVASVASDLMARAAKVFPGGVIGTFAFPKERPFTAARGLGSRVWDLDGNEYIDYVCGSGPMVVGHSHPRVVEAVRRQIESGFTFYSLNESAVRLGELIVEAAPCGESVKLSSSGAEATFYALRLARAFTKRDKILKFDGAYHGHHDYAMMGSRGDNYPLATPDSRGIPAPVAGTVLLSAFNDIELTRRIITEHAHELAAVIVEPVQRVIPPAPGFLEMLREVTAASGIVLIFDEVVTGFRVAWGGAQEYFGVTPDLATYGKAIGGGFPVSAVAGRAEILALANPVKFSGPDLVYISGTLNGNPVGAAAGVATLEVLREPGVYAQLWARSSRLKTEVEAVAKRLGIGLQLAGFGPVLRSVFTDREVKSHADLKSGDPVKNDKFCRALLRRGVFWNPDKTYVSTAHTDEDIARTIQAAEESLRELAQQA